MTKISLRSARVNANLTINEACKKIGVSFVTLQKWETGKVKPRAIMHKGIASAYHLDENNIKWED